MLRALAVITGSVTLLWSSVCPAAPPVYPRGLPAGLAAGRFASGLPAPHFPAKPLGVDAPERVRSTAGTTLHAVVILLQFTDWPADTLNHTPADYQTLLFSKGVLPTGSMRDYYNEVSGGQFDIDGTVIPKWYTAPRLYSEYTNGQSGLGVGISNAQLMAYDAVTLADPDIDFSQFDGDGNGRVDAVFVIHAGPGAEETGSTSDIWSHKWNLPNGPAPVDGISAYLYTTEPEEWGITTPWTTADSLMTVGVFCHEFGHILGLPDLYDTSGAPDANEGLGEWDLMASGLYTHRNGDPMGSCPAHLSAYCKTLLGWITPTTVFQDTPGLTIPPVETSGEIYRLWTNGVEAGEYFLVENRQPIGFDSGLVRQSIEDDVAGNPAAHGLMIYHVDGGIIGNNDPTHKMVDVEEGGGIEAESGFTGVQNLDLASHVSAALLACDVLTSVTGNRGDRYDPWPGLGGRTAFGPITCPNSDSYCGGTTQVSIQNISEVGQSILADFYVTGTSVRRRALAMDDTPFEGNSNNGNGLAEPGEVVQLHFPLENLGTTATGELTAKVHTSSFYLALAADSIYYGAIGGAATDSGSVILATVNPSPDPEGVNIRYTVNGPAGLVLEDSVQVLLGQRSGICEDFESTARRWVGIPVGCGGTNEWHRESGIDHTPGGVWAWRLGPSGLIGHYAPSEDARLVSQPIRLVGSADTLRFWQRYDCEFAFDGLTVEISTNSGATWTQLDPVGGYTFGDRYSGTQTTFTEAVVPLTGYSGIVQVAFRFRSTPPNEGLGWWIDDVTVTGDAACTTTGIDVERFEASAPAGSSPSVQLAWTVSRDRDVTLGIDRAVEAGPRVRLVTFPGMIGEGAYVDASVVAGVRYRYWLVASREGEPSAEAGPILVEVPASGPAAPRVLSLSPVRPNPFNPRTTVSVSLDRDGPFMLRVYRSDGTLVRTVAQGRGTPSVATFTWDGTDDRGRPVGSGLYLFELRSGNRTRVQKAVLLR